jgi:hypothetical protein
MYTACNGRTRVYGPGCTKGGRGAFVTACPVRAQKCPRAVALGRSPLPWLRRTPVTPAAISTRHALPSAVVEKVQGMQRRPPKLMMRCLRTTMARNTRTRRSLQQVRSRWPRAAKGYTFQGSCSHVRSRPAQPFFSASSSDTPCRMRSRRHLDLLSFSQPEI